MLSPSSRKAFCDEVENQWGDMGLRNIGHVRYARASSVDIEGGTLAAEDWNAFEVDEAKVKPEFKAPSWIWVRFNSSFSYLPRSTQNNVTQELPLLPRK